MNRIFRSNKNVEVFNVVESISKAKPLYMKLIKLSHPDKYQDYDKQQIAQNLTTLLNENKFNYSELQKIEEKIYKELI